MCEACQNYRKRNERPRCRCGGHMHRPFYPPRKHVPQNKCLESPQQFAKDFEAARNQALPVDGKPFESVAVLGLTWSNDHTDPKPTEEKLLRVFREKYNFACESFVIPTHEDADRAVRELSGALEDFSSRHNNDGSLLIVVYLGYTSERAWECDGQALRISRPSLSAFSQRGVMHDLLDRFLRQRAGCEGRVLNIFDCFWGPRDPLNDKSEFLACPMSTGHEKKRDSPPHNFVDYLAEYLDSLDGEPRSISQVHGDMLRKQIEKGVNRMPFHMLEKGGNRSPFYVPGESGHSSIVLAPQSQEPTITPCKSAIEVMDKSEHRALIYVKLTCEKWISGVTDWQGWLTSHLPAGTHSVRVESVELSPEPESNGLLTVSLPLELWECLSDDRKRCPQESLYTFISYMRDHREHQAPSQSTDRPRRSFRLKHEKPFFNGVPPKYAKKDRRWGIWGYGGAWGRGGAFSGRGGARGGGFAGRGGSRGGGFVGRGGGRGGCTH
ncbi:hypothetical protein HDK77DRAFT_216667 [Phyllosticta capitalensis]